MNDTTTTTTRRFPLGRLLITPGAKEALQRACVAQAMGRHAQGDWGDCCPEDRQSNDEALVEGYRLFSVYHDRCGAKFWIITEADRSATTVLLPEEY